jgi:lysophospholipase L1-like esterase
VLVEIVLLFLVAEIFAAFLLPPGLSFVHPQMVMEPNSRRIYFHRANQSAFTIDKPFVTNSMGFRDERELPIQKNAEFRILSLGDSITVGLGVAAEDTYVRKLEKLLERRDARIWAINAGVGSYGSWQEVDLLRERAIAVKPDIVTLAFYWNDLYSRPAKVIPIPSPQSGARPDAALRYLRILKRSRVLSLLRERWATLANRISPSFDWSHRDMIFKGMTSPYLERAYGDVGKSLEEFKSLQHAYGFVPILVIIPMPMQVRQFDLPPTHMQQRIEALARKAGLRALDVLPALRIAYAEKGDVYIPWDNEHFTPRGHQVVAEALERYLEAEHLVPTQAKAPN